MFTFSTLTGSQLHFMALQFVAQQYERVCTTKLLWAHGLFYETRVRRRRCQRERERERNRKKEVE